MLFTDNNMSSTVCQGLQSCLEPWFLEPCVLRHKLAPSKPNYSQSSQGPQRPNLLRQHENRESPQHENNTKNKSSANCSDSDRKSNNNGGSGGWSFIQALIHTSHNSKDVTDQSEKVYVHPLVKRSSSKLSLKSLEMCTESLGSETGSEISESSEEFLSLSPKFHEMQGSKSRELFTKKMTRSSSFPPPLTSISGLDGVQVMSHRESGRLVIKVVNVSSRKSYLQAERVDGRLRLCLLKDCSVNCERKVAVETEHECVNDAEAEAEVEEAYYDDNDDGCWGEGMDGISGTVECEIGNEEFPNPRPSRCKEDGNESKELSNWGPFWVATS